MPNGPSWLPPYFGSWDDLIAALMHNPYLGSGHGPPGPRHLMMSGGPGVSAAGPSTDPWGPSPEPWRHVVQAFVAAVSVRDLASHVADQTVRQQMEASANHTITQLLEDYCGTPPRVWPWPWPGPPPWVIGIASELNAIANTVQEGSLRHGLHEVAGQVAARGFTARGS